jgi:hypothetical protein
MTSLCLHYPYVFLEIREVLKFPEHTTKEIVCNSRINSNPVLPSLTARTVVITIASIRITKL